VNAISAIRSLRHGLAEIPISDFKMFTKLLAEYDLWDEMEAHLQSQGLPTLFISAETMRAIGARLQEKIAIGDLPADMPAIQLCGCNSTYVPPPKTPPSAPDGGGGGDAGGGHDAQ
jgi:hypothetical protein